MTSHAWGGGDSIFQKALSLSRQVFHHPLYHEWRLYLASNLLTNLLTRKPINYVECGVGEGHTLYVFLTWAKLLDDKMLLENINNSSFYLFDTFNGVDIDLVTNKERIYVTETYPGGDLKDVKNRFKAHPNADIAFTKGSVPTSLTDFDKQIKVDFLHIDMNNMDAEVGALEFFIDQISDGGIILFDDYAFQTAADQKEGIDQFMLKNNLNPPLTLPTGQGLFLNYRK